MDRQQSVVTGSVAVWTDSEGGGVVEMAIFALFCISQEAGAVEGKERKGGVVTSSGISLRHVFTVNVILH